MPRTSSADQTKESLKSVADQLQELSSAVRAVSEGMESAGFESLTLSHYDALTQGVTKLLSFAGAAKITLFKAREERGDFRASTANGRKKSVSVRKKKRPKNKDLRLANVSESENHSGGA